MPPPNLTPATARDLAADLGIPFTQDPGSTGNDLWYTYDPQPGDTVLGFWGFGDLASNLPATTVYTGTPSSLTQLQSFFATVNLALQIPLFVGTQVFIKVHPSVVGDITISVLRAPNITAPIGSIFVNDDEPGFPAALIDSVTGDLLKFGTGIGAGEAGDVLLGGEILIQYKGAPNRFQLLGADLIPLTNVAFTYVGDNPTVRANPVSDQFYLLSAGSGGTAARATTVSPTGVLGPTTWTFTGRISITAGAPANDDSLFYFAGGAQPVRTWDLNANIAGPDLVAALPGYAVRDLLVLGDDSILVQYTKGGGSPEFFVKRFDPTGTLLTTYTYSSVYNGEFGHIARALDDPTSFWLWTHLPGVPEGTSRFYNIRVSDGAVLSFVDSTEYELGIYNGAATASPTARFGNSISCPFLILQGEVVVPTGTLVVEKITSPTGSLQTFDFTAPGQSPDTFSLGDGDSQTFADIPVGTYAVSEIVPDGWTQSDVTVSNGSPADAITIADGETVTVTFTNTENPVCPGIRGAPYIGA